MVQKLQTGDNQVTQNIMEFARLIWLAGLGAFAKVEEEGGKLFEALVKEGERVEACTRKMAGDTIQEVKGKVEAVADRATDTWDKLEEVFEDRVARVLNRLGVPTIEDIEELSRRVEALTESVRGLSETEKRG